MDFYAPQLNLGATQQGIDANQNLLLNPLALARSRQAVTLGGQQVESGQLNLDMLRQMMQFRTQALQGYSQQDQPIEPGTQQAGAQAIGGVSGGIQNGPQVGVAQPQTQGASSPLDALLDPRRIAANAQYGSLSAMLSGQDPNKPIADAVALEKAARDSNIQKQQLAVQQNVLSVSEPLINDPAAASKVYANEGLRTTFKNWVSAHGGDPNDPSLLTNTNVQFAAWDHSNQARIAVGMPPLPPLERFAGVNQGLGQVANRDILSGKLSGGTSAVPTDNFVVPDKSAVSGIRIQQMPKAQGITRGLAPADAQTLALATISPQEIKMAGDQMAATGVFPQWLAGRDSFTRAIFGTALAKRFDAEGNTQAALAAKAQEYTASGEVLNSFTDGKSGPSQTLVAVNTATQHLGVLRPLVQALDNGGSQAVNKAAQAFSQQFGGTAPVTFDAVKQFVTQEVSKVNIPGGGLGAERSDLADSLARSNTFGQLNDVLDKYQQLMAGKTEALRNAWNVGTKGQHGPFDQFLLPATKSALNNPATGSGTAPAAAIEHLRQNPSLAPQFKAKYGYLPNG